MRISGSGNLLIGTTSDTGLTGSGNTKTGKIFYDESGRIGRRTAELVTQTSHGFSIGNVLYLTGTTWTKAKADAISTSNALGVVESVPSSDTFVVVLNGTVDVTSWGLSANTTYYLSDGTAGLLTSTAPTSTSSYLIPVLRTSSTTVGYVHPLPVYPLAAAPIASGGTAATTSYGAYDNLSGAETTVASATTTDIGAAASNKVSITGTTTITGFGTVAAGVQRWGRFTGALTLTHNATSLILPGAANITTAAGDSFHAYSLGSGNWVVVSYSKADGSHIKPTGIGYMPVVFALGVTPASTNGSGTTLAINGGTVMVPIVVTGYAKIDTLWLSNRDSASAHTLEARLYIDDASGSLQFVTGTDCSFSYTPSGNSNLSAQISVPGTLLRPGLYWLLIRNTSASVTAAMGGIGANLTNGHYYATKTLGSALGSTVDVSSGWSAAGSVFISAYYTGRIAGLSSAF